MRLGKGFKTIYFPWQKNNLRIVFPHLASRIAEVQIPVQAYRGKNGTFILSASFTSVATNANTGPVEPMIVNGCALVSA